MARFCCSNCGEDGDFVYSPSRHECPCCGSPDVVFALGLHEVSDDLIDALVSAEPLDDHTRDED
jgi:hypothetical protein